MRSLLMLVLLTFCLMPCVGCGGKPDPRDRPDFVDTTKPDVAADMLEAPGAAPKKPASGP